MKRMLVFLCPLLLLGAATGCDEIAVSGLPADVQAIVAGIDGVKLDFLSQDSDPAAGDQIRQRLQDGSCEGDGNAYQYGGSNGNGSGGGSGNGDQLRLRDGSCQDG